MTVGYASGVIPRIPLNLVLVKGMESSASSSRTSHPTSSPATMTNCGICSHRRRSAAHRAGLSARRDRRGADGMSPIGKAIGKVLIDLPNMCEQTQMATQGRDFGTFGLLGGD